MSTRAVGAEIYVSKDGILYMSFDDSWGVFQDRFSNIVNDVREESSQALDNSLIGCGGGRESTIQAGPVIGGQYYTVLYDDHSYYRKVLLLSVI